MGRCYNRPMKLDALLSLITAALAGATMGSFLLLTVIHRPLFTRYLDTAKRLLVYSRFYRMNMVLCLTGGVTAALIKYPQASLLLGILAASYVFASMYLIKNLQGLLVSDDAQSRQLVSSLTLVQNLLHFIQFIGAGWVVFYLI
ncbi:MAG: hypothetical protein EP315_07790 [Gammaproteobacteria bacterium]|nr:MAG: hypothetical protein EP315_07790 [Gammaproteobacteria bacterium]